MAKINVRKRGNSWEFRFETARVGDKRTQVSKGGFETKKAALEAGTEAMNQYNNSGAVIEPSKISLSDYLDQWMEKYCKVALKPATVENYEKNIRLRIKPALGQYALSSVKTASIQKLINDMFNEGYSRNTISTVKRILSGAMRYAIDTDGVLLVNPTARVRLPSVRAVPENPTRSSPNVFIPPEMIDRIFARFPEGTSTFIPMQLGYRCGMRIGEAFGVCWDDVDFDAMTISIKRQAQWDVEKQQWYMTAPKYDSFRTIEMDEKLGEILQREHEKQLRARQYYGERYTQLFVSVDGIINTTGEGNKIFPVAVREDGTYIGPRTMQHASGVIHHELGYPEFTFHSLRHTHATMLVESGAPIKYVQERLGHKDAQVTMRIYSHLSQKQKSDGRALIDKIFS
nr:MAG TPA: Integrase [Caudoviricetes sp.]